MADGTDCYFFHYSVDYPNLKSLVAYLASQLLDEHASSSESLPAAPQQQEDEVSVEHSSAFGDLQELSQEELAGLLATELALID